MLLAALRGARRQSYGSVRTFLIVNSVGGEPPLDASNCQFQTDVFVYIANAARRFIAEKIEFNSNEITS